MKSSTLANRKLNICANCSSYRSYVYSGSHHVSSWSINLHTFSLAQPKPQGKSYTGSWNFSTYISIFLYPALKISGPSIASSSGLCLLSLVGLFSGFHSLNCSQDYALRQKTRVSIWLISLVPFLSMIAVPWYLFFNIWKSLIYLLRFCRYLW